MTQNKIMNSGRTVAETHNLAVKYAASYLADKCINTCQINDESYQLVLDNGTTIAVRGLSDRGDIFFVTGNLRNLNAHIMIIVTDIDGTPKISIMDTETAKNSAENRPKNKIGIDNWFIRPSVYMMYNDNTTILTDGYNTTIKVHTRKELNIIRKVKEVEAKVQSKVDERAAFRADYERRHNIISGDQ